MKLLVVLFLAAYTAAKTPLGHSSNVRHYHHKALQTRGLLSGACDFVCGSTGGSGITVQKSWQVDLRANADIGLLIVYEGNTNSLAFINFDKEVAIIFTGNKQIFGIFNFRLNVGLVINKANGVAKYITTSNNTSLFVGTGVNYYAGVFAYANAIFTAQKDITGIASILLLNSQTFNFESYINYVVTGRTGLLASIFGKKQIYAQVELGFKGIFSTIANKASSGFRFEFGIYNALVGVLGNVDGYSYGLLLIVTKFAVSAEGFYNGVLIYTLTSQLSLYVEAFKRRVIARVELSAELTLNFFAAASATANVLFGITVNGFIMIGGIIKGSIENAGALVGGLLGGISIGVNVEFKVDVSAYLGAVVSV